MGLSKNYTINRLAIREVNNKKIIAVFQIDGLFFKLCLFGYTKQEQYDEEYDTLYFDEEGFQEFMDEFLEMFRSILRKYVELKPYGINNIFIKEVRLAANTTGIDLIEYKKRIRTAERLFV